MDAATYLLLSGVGSASPAPSGPLSRVRVTAGRFANDAGYLGLRCLTEFSLPYHCGTGNEREVVRRLDRAAGAGRNAVRYLLMATNLFKLSPKQPGYWAAVERARVLANERGLYVEPCLFADAQVVLPDHEDRKALVRDYAAWCLDHPGVIPQLTNEPHQNGFTGVDDPQLLELADLFKSLYPSRDFSIGDPPDVVTSEAGGEPLGGLLEGLAQRSSILVLHGDRTVDESRYARWVDHLKGFTDFRDRAAIEPCGLWHDEPMGMASQEYVPIPGHNPYRREWRAEALVAAACCSAIFQIAFTTHYISEQDDAIPGLEESAIAADIPHGPEWQFINAVTTNSPVVDFDGFEKVRPCTNGPQAWACAYGHQKGTIQWAAGFRPTKVFDGVNVEVWKADR